MTLTVDLAPDEQYPTVWPLESFVRGDFASVPKYCELQLDHLNAEFGLLYRLEDSTSIIAQYPDNDEPVYFEASWALAVCTRSNSGGPAAKKVCIQLLNYQIDLEFECAGHAQRFVAALKALATKALMFYEAPGNAVFMKDKFRITQLPNYCAQPNYAWSMVDDATPELNQLWKSGKHSDLIVKAGNRVFDVHKVVLCSRSAFFDNACKPGFMEAETGCIQLEEDAVTTEALLTELYGVENCITGSVFTTFALQPLMKKESIMTTLLSLFVAADKYDLPTTKARAATAFTDRLAFIHDPSVLLGLASRLLGLVPESDWGLSIAMIRYVQAHLPAIMKDDEARDELAQEPLVYMAVLRGFADMVEEGELAVCTKSSSGLPTPPASPVKARKYAGMGPRKGVD